MNWGRKFLVHIPVHDPCRWSDKLVGRALIDALNLLTGDDWQFDFRTRKVSAESPRQDRMIFPANAEAVIAYSEGMNSCAVAGDRKRTRLNSSHSCASRMPSSA